LETNITLLYHKKKKTIIQCGFIEFTNIYIEKIVGKTIILTETQIKVLISKQLNDIGSDVISESKGDFEVYHNTYASAISEALKYVNSRGFETNGDEVWDKISVGPKKPSEGQTNKITLTLLKDGKEQKKALHLQIYNMGKKYELNLYIN
jgi:hypothetical protein